MVSVSGNSAFGIIISIIVLVILIFNTVYISGVRRELRRGNANLSGLTTTGADLIYAVDIILCIIIGLYLIYNIYLIATTKEQQRTVKEVITKPREGTGLPTGFTSRRTTTVTPAESSGVPTTTTRRVTTVAPTEPATTTQTTETVY